MILKTFTLGAWNVQQFFFVSSLRFFVKLKHSLIKKLFVNWCASTRHNFYFLKKNLKFPTFSSFRFWPLYKNRKLGKLGNSFETCSCFAGRTWKFPRFPSFGFWPSYKNRKLGKLGNCLKTCKLDWLFLFVRGNWKVPRF